MSYGNWAMRNWQTRALSMRNGRNWQTRAGPIRNWLPGAANNSRTWQVGGAPMWNWQPGMALPWNWQAGVAPLSNWYTGAAASLYWQTGVAYGVGNLQTGMAPWGNWQTRPLTPANWHTGLDCAYLPVFFSFPTVWDPSGGGLDPWRRPLEERMLLNWTGFPSLHHPPVQILVLENDMERQATLELLAHEEQSRLTQDKQRAALAKLKKEIYNPRPTRITESLNGDFQDNAREESEDGDEKEKEKDEDTTMCPICLEDFKPKEEVLLTPCNHMFHEDCLVPWVKSHGQCPICRFQFASV